MKKKFHTGVILGLVIMPFWHIDARHLDGLWRNDRENITVRIETTDEGIKAKRTDQGIWYFYDRQDDQYYVDQRGNYYEVVDDDHLIWREGESKKRFLFNRVNSSTDDRWNDDRDRYDVDERDEERGREKDYRNDFRDVSMQGVWINDAHRREIKIDQYRHGISVRRADGRRIIFNEVDGPGLYRNANGDTIRLLNSHTLQWKSRERGFVIVFHRDGYR